MRDTKRLLRDGLGSTVTDAIFREASYFGPRLAGTEAREAIAAILGKRPPDFSKFQLARMALLDRTVATLSAAWYHDPAQYARELEAIWYRDWVCVGRSEELPEAGDYLVAEVGDQRMVVTRDRGGATARFPQHLPPSRLDPLYEAARPVRGQPRHLSVSRLELRAFGRASWRPPKWTCLPTSTARITRSTASRSTPGVATCS